MHVIRIFENEEFGQIRTIQDEKGNPLFCGTDVAGALGYAKTRNAVNRHCRYALKQGIPHPQNKNKIIEMLFIPESDVYRLVIKSKLPSAERFERWVFEIVLPSIRKFGGYVTKETLDSIFQNSENLHTFLTHMLEVSEENNRLNKELKEAKLKTDFFDTLVDTKLLINFRTVAKELGVKPMHFTQFLLDKKYVFRDSKQLIHPMQGYVHDGLFEIKEFCKNGHCGTQTLITPKGRNHFLRVLIEHEIIIK